MAEKLQVFGVAGGAVGLGGASVETTCQLTCPVCGHVSMESMPTDACIYFHDCTACGTLIRPKQGDCCVFCSYGSQKCPPIQLASDCCAANQ